MEILFFALILLGIPFVLPIVLWFSGRTTRKRVDELEGQVESQRAELETLHRRLNEVTQAGESQPGPAVPATAPGPVPTAAPSVAPPAAPVVPPAPVSAPPAGEVRPREVPVPAATPAIPPPPPKPAVPVVPPAAVPPRAEQPRVSPPPVPAAARTADRPAFMPPPPPPPEAPARPAFDWEGLVGVKLFSAIAGVALVVAAVLFLRYSMQAGWLQPPVRVAIGVSVAIALLVLCELKAARRYPLTANAMDAAAVAILFATFFAAHALWNLIPAIVAFGLLALVTLIAVLLSIRRESLFIAVLGLLGGFATPALLSTGENRPIPLFAYLLLLNVGLAWIASNRGWRVLTWLTLIFTTVYQWGWVIKFLDQSSLSLAMGIFLVFPIAAMTSGFVRRRSSSDWTNEQSSLVSAALPLVFAVYLAVVPAYGAHAWLLLGFLFLIDAGLLALAIAGRPVLHVVGAAATLLVLAAWVGTSYERSGSPSAALAFTALFTALYTAAPVIARWFGRTLGGPARSAEYFGPVMLFVLPVLAAIEPSFAEPWLLVAVLLGLVLLIAARAITGRVGPVYYIAGFFAIATQAVWSTTHLTLERLGTAVVMYALFGVTSLAVPIVARRVGRALQPAWGSGAVLLASLGLLLFLSAGPLAPAALWSLALLLAIANAGLFVESAAGTLPIVSQIGSVCSWLVLMNWWARAAGSVGVLPSLTVVVGLTLTTLFGHAWSVRSAGASASRPTFVRGLYLGLIGHLFLVFLASDRSWALPPWPLFGALTAITLATSAAALWIRVPSLHASGAIAAAAVIAIWSGTAGAPAWGTVVVLAAGAASAYALAWIPLNDRLAGSPLVPRAAAAALFVGELSLLLAVAGDAPPPFVILLIAHVVNLVVLLALTARYWWPYVAVGAVLPAWAAVLQWQVRPDLATTWPNLLWLTVVLYAVFVAYPFVLGRRADRDPYLAAIVASAMAFFGARTAFIAGELNWMIGIIPVVEGAILAVMLKALLNAEKPGERDLGRLALVAGAALAFVTVAIPLQLEQQWITIGWALEGAALAWAYKRIPHRGLFYSAVGLLTVVFVRLALNAEVLTYSPRGGLRIFNWYLYTYLLCAAALFLAAWFLAKTDDRLPGLFRVSTVLPAGATILLFLLLNIEIADYYAAGPTVMFRFGVSVGQDLTYTIGWLVFGMGMLAAGIWLANRPARIAAVTLIAVTTFKCFLYDLGSLEGLHRVASFVGLGISLALVSMALQKYVLKVRNAA